jgi:hypothetical protein
MDEGGQRDYKSTGADLVPLFQLMYHFSTRQMTIAKFIETIRGKLPPAPADALRQFESEIGERLPDDYRAFLENCNGGSLGGRLLFTGPTPSGAKTSVDIHHIGGFRTEKYFSLPWYFKTYRDSIPKTMIWIMGDSCGNAICLALSGPQRGHVYFLDHEADEVELLANSFTEFVELVYEPQ